MQDIPYQPARRKTAVPKKFAYVFVGVGIFLLTLVLWRGGFWSRSPYVLTGADRTKLQPDGLITRAVQDVTDQAPAVDLLRGQWRFLPGVHAEQAGLRVRRMGFALVQQNGEPGESRPPVNLFGTHLEAKGAFAVTIAVSQRRGPAQFSLYGQVPITADEFEIERPYVRLTIESTKLNVEVKSANTTSRQTLDIPRRDATHVKMARQNGLLIFSVDGQELGRVKEQGVFDSGQVWFGADSTGSDWLLSALIVEKIGSDGLQIVDASSMRVSKTDSHALQILTDKKRPDFKIGAAVALAPAVTDAQYARVLFGGNFGAITPENALKMQFLQPQKGNYDFSEADALVSLAERHGLAVHGHALVFGEANPRWVQELPRETPADKQDIEQVMLDHISTVAKHYQGRVKTWDVINEPLADEGGLRSHIWYQAMGEAYIAKALCAAHSADPGALLFINEYGLESGSDERWQTFIALLNRLQAQQVPLHGVGMQAHVFRADDLIDTTVLRERIRQLAAMNLKVRISEISVYGYEDDDLQAKQYSDVLQTCIDEPHCVSWTTWGVSDRYNWWKEPGGSPRQGRDFLWSDTMQPRPAVVKLQKTLL